MGIGLCVRVVYDFEIGMQESLFQYGHFSQVQEKRKAKRWTMFLGMRSCGQRSDPFAHVADHNQRRSLLSLTG